MYVWKKQPWIIHRQNLLLERVDPSKEYHDYRFQYMYVTVKLFGIPREARTFAMVHEIVEQLGQPSDLDQLTRSDLYRDALYVTSRVKINIFRAAKDKVFVQISDTRSIIVFIHCEKVQRICTYCAAFFHNNYECPARNETVMTAGTVSNQDLVPFDRFGTWMTQVSDIPMDYVLRQIRIAAAETTPPSPLLSRLCAVNEPRSHQITQPQVTANSSTILQLGAFNSREWATMLIEHRTTKGMVLRPAERETPRWMHQGLTMVSIQNISK